MLFVPFIPHHYSMKREDTMEFFKTDNNTYLCSYAIESIVFLDEHGDSIDIMTLTEIHSVLIVHTTLGETRLKTKEAIRWAYMLISNRLAGCQEVSLRKEFRE
jgi:hypothetical protein